MLNNRLIKPLLLLLLVLPSMLFSAELNIVNEDPKASIFVDGQLAGTGSVYQLSVNQGEHHVKVVSNNAIIYSEIVNVKEDSTRTINTTRFIGAAQSNVIDIEAETIEKNRVKKSKGTIAVGFQLGSEIHGLSLKGFFTDRVGAQVLYFSREENGSLSEYSTVHGRLIYNLKERLSHKGRIRTFYTGIGYGSKKETFSRSGEDVFIIDPFNVKEATVFELFIGMEIPTSPYTYINAEASYLNLDGTQKGFENDAPSDTYSDSDLRLSIGFHYYF